MPQELPGFYYDPEKNRYFPVNGPIPGSSRKRKSPPPPPPPPSPSAAKEKDRSKCMRIRRNNLLQARELCGQVITSRTGKFSFQMEYQKKQASHPTVWKYNDTERAVYGAIEQMSVGVERLAGLVETDILLTGSVNGSLCLFEVGDVGDEFDLGVKCLPDRVWPSNAGGSTGCIEFPAYTWEMGGLHIPSAISCVKYGHWKNALITTLGSEISGGTLYNLNLGEPFDLSMEPLLRSQVSQITSLDCTIWTADCNRDGSRAVIGTNKGAALVNIDTGRRSWICCCKSDVFSIQLDRSGNIALCGLRNGAILSIDARQRPENVNSILPRHMIPCHPRETSTGKEKKLAQEKFQLKGNMLGSGTISLPSSICCIKSLVLSDQYFLASSMNGMIKLYDNRMTQRGAIISYEGNVNTHTRIQLGVDPSENIVMSGGEDCKMRLWSIKSGEMLFQDKFMNSIPNVVCWPRTSGVYDVRNRTQGAWLGSQEGLFYVGWP